MKKFLSYAAVGFGVSFVVMIVIGYAIEADSGYNKYGGTDNFAVFA